MMASLGVNAANTSYVSITTELEDLYTNLGGDVSTDYTGAGEVFGTGGAIDQVSKNANSFVEEFRGASTDEGFRISFDAEEWTVNAGMMSYSDLETARGDLRDSESALLDQITSDLVGDGSVANSWGSAELAKARSLGGLVGNLTADIQVSTRDISHAAATSDVQTAYETDGSLDSLFASTTTEVAELQARVNTTRSAVATTRDGFSNTGTAVGGNTSQIIADSSDKSLTELVYTNATSDHIQISDYFTNAVSLVDSDSNVLLEEITDTFIDNSGVYAFGVNDFPSFTDFVLERNGTVVRGETNAFGGGGIFYPITNGWGLASEGTSTAQLIKNLGGGGWYQFDISISGSEYIVNRYGSGVVYTATSAQDAFNWLEANY